MKWSAEMERQQAARHRRTPIPSPIPTMSSSIYVRAKFRIDGPADEREKTSYDERIARRAESQQEEVNYSANAL